MTTSESLVLYVFLLPVSLLLPKNQPYMSWAGTRQTTRAEPLSFLPADMIVLDIRPKPKIKKKEKRRQDVPVAMEERAKRKGCDRTQARTEDLQCVRLT